MLGTFLTDSGPVMCRRRPVCGRADWGGGPVGIKQYGDRPQTQYDHGRDPGAAGVPGVRRGRGRGDGFIAARVAKTRDSRRELFDRAVVWLIENRVVLPGITML